MDRRTISIAALPLAALLAMSAGAQDAASGGGGSTGGANGAPPAEAATTRTPGTPGAADTPGALSHPNNNLPAASSGPKVAALKKQADKESQRNARAAADAHKPSSDSAPK
jgi:hypothetical protein